MKKPKIYSPYKSGNIWKCRVVTESRTFWVSGKTRSACQLSAVDKANEIMSNVVCSTMRVDALCRVWMSERCSNLAPATVIEWQRLVDKWIVVHLGGYKLSEIRNVDVQRLITLYNKNHSSKSCSALLGVIHHMFEFAIANELIQKNPAKDIFIAKTQPYEYYIYSTDEMLNLYATARGTNHFLPIILASRCGLRLSEICGLRWADIDFKNGILKIRQVIANGGTKGSTPIIKIVPKTATSGKPIVIPQSVIDYLQTLERKHVLVFCKDDGAPWLPRNYSHSFADFIKSRGLPKTRFHDLRHFVATSLMDAGLSDKEIAEYMRHADTDITRHYEHIREHKKQNASLVIDELLSSTS